MTRVAAVLIVALSPTLCLAQQPLLEAHFDGSDVARLVIEAPQSLSAFASLSGPYVTGLRGQARVLGGLNRLSYFVNKGFFPPQGTLSMWVRPEDWTPAKARHFVFFLRIIYTNTESGYARLLLYKLWDSDEIALLVQNTPLTDRSTLIRVPAADWNEGEWHHLAVTWDRERYRLFIDGEPVGEAAAIALPADGRWEISPGTPYQSWKYIGDEKTVIDELTIWGEPLSQQRIARMYAETLAAAPPEAFQRVEVGQETSPVPGNLALADEGAWVLASSFADHEAHYPDNLIDGREASVWAPFGATLPQWLEVRWRLPRRVDGVVVRQQAAGHISALSVMAWLGGEWKRVATLRDAPRDDTELRVGFDEVLTDRVRVIIEEGEAEGLALTSLAVTGPPQPVIERMPVGKGTEQIELRQVRIDPQRARPGDSVRIEITVAPQARLTHDYVFAVEVGETPLEAPWTDMFVAGRVLAAAPPTSQWEPGSEHTIACEVYLPSWTPDGPVEVYLRGRAEDGTSLQVTDAQGEPIGTVATLNIDRFDEAGAERLGVPSAALSFRGGSARFLLGAREMPPLAWAMTMPSFERYDRYSGTGVRIYHLKTMPLSYDDAPGHFQRVCAHLDQRFRMALRVDPGALFIVNPDLRPEGEWLERNPDERLVTARGKLGPVSFFSARYTEGVHEYLRRLVRWVNDQPYADHVVGWLPYVCGSPDSVMGGIEDNLFQEDRSLLTFGDYNPQALADFRGWLRSKYKGSIEDLRAAWHDPDLTFETATPDVAELAAEGVDGGVFRDPLGSAMTFDYAEWMSSVVGRFNSELMRIVKQGARREVLAGTYYGYNVAHLRGYNTPGAWLQNNNFDLIERLQDPNWDFFAAPTPYSNRRPGSSHYTLFTLDSLRLHGKLHIGEIDHRTFIAAQKRYGRLRSERETAAVMRRDMAGLMIDGQGYWFSDWSRGEGREGVGWFLDPGILETIRQARQVHELALRRERRSVAQIAVFTTGRTMRYHDVYRAAPIYHNLIALTLWDAMGKIGAPYDIYCLDDLAEPEVRDGYRLYVFLNTFFLRPEDRERIEALKADGRTLLFFYAPGYVSHEAGLSVDGISQMTGMRVVKRADREWMEYTVTDARHPVVESIEPGTSVRIEAFSYDLSVKLHPPDFGPVFAIDDEQAVVLGTYPDGQAALAVRDFGDWRSVYCAVPRMTSALLRGVARYAGVHLYCNEDVVMDADNRLLMLHSGWDGDRTVHVSLPESMTVTDAWSGEVLAESTTALDVRLPEATTRLLLLD